MCIHRRFMDRTDMTNPTDTLALFIVHPYRRFCDVNATFFALSTATCVLEQTGERLSKTSLSFCRWSL